ncbi:3D-(3,5/4)-trihydroxycyclohexane-1,2-dione hydrolase, partial [Clarias magur]
MVEVIEVPGSLAFVMVCDCDLFGHGLLIGLGEAEMLSSAPRTEDFFLAKVSK